MGVTTREVGRLCTVAVVKDLFRLVLLQSRNAPKGHEKKKKDDVIVCAGLVVVLHFASVRCFVDVFYHYLRIIYCCICRLQHSDDKRCSWWRGGGKSRGLDSSAAGIITHISYDTYNSKFNKPICSNDD